MEKCSKRVYRGTILGRSCNKNATVFRDGKWFCGTHDPVRVKERMEARDKKWDSEFEAGRKARDQDQRRREAGELGIALAEFILQEFLEDRPCKERAIEMARNVIDARDCHDPT